MFKVQTVQDSALRVGLLTFNADIEREIAGSHNVLSFGHIHPTARPAQRLGRIDQSALVVPLKRGCRVPVQFAGHLV